MNNRMIRYDYISDAINKGYANTTDDELFSTGWDEFNNALKGKRLYLFGCGNGLLYFMYYYHLSFEAEAIVDNNRDKIGQPINEYMWEFCARHVCKKEIQSPEILKKDAPDSVVLITSLKGYEEIAVQLRAMGCKNIASLLLMEEYNAARKLYKPDTGLTNEKLAVDEIVNAAKIKENKIVFFMEMFLDHGRQISNRLLELGTMEIVWIVERKTIAESRIRQIELEDIFHVMEELETAKVILASVLLPPFYVKRKGQTYIQLKHWGSVTLKKFFLDAFCFDEMEGTRKGWKEDTKKIDYIITGSWFDTQSCRKGFEFEGECLEFGSCRSDQMFCGKENREHILKELDIKQDCRIAIYAPTYRWKGVGFERKIQDCILNLDALSDTLNQIGEKWVIFLRLHPGLKGYKEKFQLTERMVDVTDYYDGEALVSASDIMITDYSSIMFEMAYVKNPVFLFAPDYEEYTKNEYDFLIDYNSLPFPVAKDTEELANNIKYFNEEEYRRKVTDFLEEYGVHEDGHASERTADFISKLLEA